MLDSSARQRRELDRTALRRPAPHAGRRSHSSGRAVHARTSAPRGPRASGSTRSSRRGRPNGRPRRSRRPGPRRERLEVDAPARPISSRATSGRRPRWGRARPDRRSRTAARRRSADRVVGANSRCWRRSTAFSRMASPRSVSMIPTSVAGSRQRPVRQAVAVGQAPAPDDGRPRVAGPRDPAAGTRAPAGSCRSRADPMTVASPAFRSPSGAVEERA